MTEIREEWYVRGTIGKRLGTGALSILILSGTVAGTGSTAVAEAGSTDPVEQYVTQVYNDLFDRKPDPEGLRTWTSRLKSGTPYGEVSNGITYSREFRSGLITDTYLHYLGREPDAGGLEHWLGEMGRGLLVEQLAARFIASDEFYLQAGSDDAQWIADLYGTVLGREAADSEIDFWLEQLDRGSDEWSIALSFVFSAEYLTGVVDGYYQHLLRRDIDPVGRDTWVYALQTLSRDEQIIANIVSSTEYRNGVGTWTPRFVEPADRYADTILITYSENLDCASVDADGSDFTVTVNGSPHPDSDITADCYPGGYVELFPASMSAGAFDDEVRVGRRAGSTVLSPFGVAQPVEDTVEAVALGD